MERMRIIVKARTRAKETKVELVSQETLALRGVSESPVYKVSVKEPPVDGRANEAIIRALALHFDVASSTIRLVGGATNKQKVFEVPV